MAQYPSGQKPSPDTVPKIERDDFPAPPFPYLKKQQHQQQQQQSAAGAGSGGAGSESAANLAATGNGEEPQVQASNRQRPQQRSSRPKSREIVIADPESDDDSDSNDPQLRKEEEELSKIANGIGKIFLQTLKEREKLRAWKRANLDPRNASRTPSATRELPTRLRYDNPTNASPSRDMDRPRPWEEEQEAALMSGGEQSHSPTRTRSSLGGRHSQMSPTSTATGGYGYKVVQSNRSTPKPGYGLTGGPYEAASQKHNGFSGAGQAGSTLIPPQTPTLQQQQQQQHHHLKTSILLFRSPIL